MARIIGSTSVLIRTIPEVRADIDGSVEEHK
jgi:hypothetical protein